MSSPAAPISAREMGRLLERWGLRRRGSNGGHEVYVTHNGSRVQIPAGGRKMDVTYPVVRKAAVAVGVNIPTFLKGPASAKADD